MLFLKKRGLQAALAMILLVGCVLSLGSPALAYSTDFPNTHTNTSDMRMDVVEIAKTQIGYGEENYETKYGAWWGAYINSSFNYTTQPWCAMFVLWCEDQAGCTGGAKGMSASSSGMLSKYRKGTNGATAYAYGSGYMPRPGDVIFVGTYGSTSVNHVGLVSAVDGTYVYTIEGNSTGNKVATGKYYLSTGCRRNSTRAIIYLGVPPYENDSEPSFDGPVFETEESSSEEPVIFTGTVTASKLYVREGTSTTTAKLDYLLEGNSVSIVEQKTVDGVEWGRLNSGGWVCMTYVVDSAVSDPEENTSDSDDPEAPAEQSADDPEQKAENYVVTASSLNVRVTPSDGKIVTAYVEGDVVAITETVTVGKLVWGKTDLGWICMSYVKLAETMESPAEEPEPQESDIPETPPEEPETPEETTETPIIKGVITASALKVRSTPSTGTVVKSIKKNTEVSIYETTLVGKTQWGRTEDGWICMSYVKITEQAEEKPQEPDVPEMPPEEPETPAEPEQEPEPEEPTVLTGVITASSLNVRKTPSTGTVVKTVKNGAEVTITETVTVGKTQWGKIDSGWICMSYVKLVEATEEPPVEEPQEPDVPETPPEEPETPEEPAETPIIKGVITASALKVRSTPSTGTVVKSIKKNTEVSIYETTLVGKTQWGRTEDGWICMSYVKITEQAEENPAEEVAVQKYIVTGSSVNVRSGPSSSYKVLKTVKKNAEILITETQKTGSVTWGHIKDSGWICMSYAKAA